MTPRPLLLSSIPTKVHNFAKRPRLMAKRRPQPAEKVMIVMSCALADALPGGLGIHSFYIDIRVTVLAEFQARKVSLT